MRIQRRMAATIRPAEFESIVVEAVVEITHHDVGCSDDYICNAPDDERERILSTMNALLDKELKRQLRSPLSAADSACESTDNLAAALRKALYPRRQAP